MRELSQELTEEQSYDIRQVIATLELENLHVSESDIRNLEDMALGRKTVEQIIAELTTSSEL